MKLDVSIGGQLAKLDVSALRFRYEVEGGGRIEREYSVAPLAPGAFSVLIGGRSYEAIVAGGEIRVNGRVFSVDVFDPREMRRRAGGGAGEGRQSIAAPMPGKVVRVLVAVDDAIEAGQGLVVVEAMKMQNEMKSPKAGRVAEVKTKADATVSAGDVLVVIE